MNIGIRSKKISASVMISMTDVIFLLLIFLLIASNFTAQTGVPFKLPGSVSQNRQSQQVLHIVYRSSNDIIFNQRSYSLENLGAELKRIFVSKDQIIRLSAESTTPLQDVISVMDVIRGTGFEKIFVATESIDTKK